ncbi:hypothetical protein ACIRRA_35385 [Nocardia sp. NPDC101769]|uniref:hypothetical protein n=1 Tax=Nocardia sp. NPDC101769 TaxID=3364333 RepID=UPI003830D776
MNQAILPLSRRRHPFEAAAALLVVEIRGRESGGADWVQHAQKGDFAVDDQDGAHLTVSVDHVGTNPPGDRMPNFLVTFSHTAQMSGDYHRRGILTPSP